MNERSVMLWAVVLVLTLSAFLAGFVLGARTAASKMSRGIEAMAHMATLRLAIDMFRSDAGRLPSEAEGLAVLRQPVLRGPYLGPDDNALLDPWGNPYVYRVPADGVPTITSFGADGAAGGEGDDADLTLWVHLHPVFPPPSASPTSSPSPSTRTAEP